MICSECCFFHSLKICVNLLLLSVFNFTFSSKFCQSSGHLGLVSFASFMKLNALIKHKGNITFAKACYIFELSSTALLSVIQHLQKSQYFLGNDFQYSVLHPRKPINTLESVK